MATRSTWGAPGARTFRVENLREELRRVFFTASGMMAFGSIFLFCLFLEIVILGPLPFWIAGIATIVFAAYRLMHVLRAQGGLYVAILIGLLVALVLWGFLGYGLLENIWPPYQCTWRFWLKAFTLTFLLMVQAALVWGIWGFWAELVDPGGPTAPRAATHRDTLIKPWDPETYGGLDLPTAYTEDIQARTITVQEQRKTELGGKQEVYSAKIPDTAPFKQFCRDVALERIGFTEAEALRYTVPLDDITHPVSGAVLMMGLRSFRDLGLHPSRGWFEWKSSKTHQRGLTVTERGRRVLAGIGEVELPTAAPSTSAGPAGPSASVPPAPRASTQAR